LLQSKIFRSIIIISKNIFYEMKTKTLRNLAFCVFFLLLLNLNFALTDYIFPCYYVYEPATLKPESIPVDLCTHIIILGCVYEQTNETIANILKKAIRLLDSFDKIGKLKTAKSQLKAYSLNGHK
jgi:hypothetical protein